VIAGRKVKGLNKDSLTTKDVLMNVSGGKAFFLQKG
jgi:hypothetical protein